MHRTRWYRWKWCLQGGKTLALCAAIVCFAHGSTARAQCDGGGTATAATGGTAVAGAVPQFQALQQLALQAQMQAQLQAQLQALRAQQQLAAQQRERAAWERADAAGERRLEFADLVGDRTACSPSIRNSIASGRATCAEQAARTTERERRVARLLERERGREEALRQRIAERDAELELRRQRALALR